MSIDVDSCYRRYGPMVYRRCRSLLADDRLAEDAMQDVFAKLLSGRERLDDRALSGLLYRMATLVSLNHLRTQRRHPETREEGLLQAIAAADDLESSTVARLLLEVLFGPNRQSTRVMATLHYVDGWTLEEVAHQTGLSVSGVRKRLGTLRRQLTELEEMP